MSFVSGVVGASGGAGRLVGQAGGLFKSRRVIPRTAGRSKRSRHHDTFETSSKKLSQDGSWVAGECLASLGWDRLAAAPVPNGTAKGDHAPGASQVQVHRTFSDQRAAAIQQQPDGRRTPRGIFLELL